MLSPLMVANFDFNRNAAAGTVIARYPGIEVAELRRLAAIRRQRADRLCEIDRTTELYDGRTYPRCFHADNMAEAYALAADIIEEIRSREATEDLSEAA